MSARTPASKTERLTILPAAAASAQAVRRVITGHVRAKLSRTDIAVMIQEAIVITIHIAILILVILIVVI